MLLALWPLLAGCGSLPRLPPLNLDEAGWRVRSGQAVWRRVRTAPELAGDFIVAAHTDGRTFVQLAKPPFTLLTAQTTPGAWQLELGAHPRRWTRAGPPPARLLWPHLPLVLEGAPPPPGWRLTWLDSLGRRAWRLENPGTGERLEGCFLP